MRINQYPYYLHTNQAFNRYWEEYFSEFPSYGKSVGLYVDFPFCKSPCTFCAFRPEFNIKEIDLVREYLDHLDESLFEFMCSVHCPPLNNIYLGGGTPSLIQPDDLHQLASRFHSLSPLAMKTIEVHPRDLTPEFIEMLSECRFNVISIGIQSFDESTCKNQNRDNSNVNHLSDMINMIHEQGMFVNLDLIALLHDTTDDGWNIFRKDLWYAAELRPDDICVCVNFRNQNYYMESIQLRAVIRQFLQDHPLYIPEHPESLSLNFQDIVDYGEEVYHLRTREYARYYTDMNPTVITNAPDIAKKNVVIGFGGSVIHNALSLAGERMELISSVYRKSQYRFLRTVTKVPPVVKCDGDTIPDIHIGHIMIKGGPIMKPALINYYARLLQKGNMRYEELPGDSRDAIMAAYAELPPLSEKEQEQYKPKE